MGRKDIGEKIGERGNALGEGGGQWLSFDAR